MILRQIDDLAIGKHAFELALDVRPFDRPVEVVEGERAAAQQELAQDRDLGLLQPQVAAFDDVDPRDSSRAQDLRA